MVRNLEAIYKLVESVLDDTVIINYESDYAKRLELQKLIYLFQEISNRSLGFDFSWYLAGPYSKVLTHTVFNNILKNLSDIKQRAGEKSFRDDVIDIIDKMKKLLLEENYEQLGLSRPQWFELLASIVYLNKNSKYINIENLPEELASAKSHFKQEQVKYGISILEKYVPEVIV
ncbi:MAG: hypothetical protein M0Z31_02560 [Clostridia bacterium]|nr:hypothetical protein [Clostridia bacterium]